jgi:formylglycine-generating enzyme required for sulfatase activity
MNRNIASRVLICAIYLFAPRPVLADPITIPTVSVGNFGNASDSNGLGGVPYNYRIGTTEVTNAQYAEFLNAKAKASGLGLYHSNMGGSRGGITQSGVEGSWSYSLKPNMENKPVIYVDWFDAVRFVNWLENGQGNGDTETGAYTLLGGTQIPSNAMSIHRNEGAHWILPNVQEWYKAAYYQPASQGGDADDYWTYPTRSNTAPTRATAINLIGPTRGDIANPGLNVANYGTGADWNGQDGNVTTVGSAGPLSASFYGTFDQGGNAWEWIEDVRDSKNRALRGGSLAEAALNMQASVEGSGNPQYSFDTFGFRVASVPEPSTRMLAGLALLVICFARRPLAKIRRPA